MPFVAMMEILFFEESVHLFGEIYFKPIFNKCNLYPSFFLRVGKNIYYIIIGKRGSSGISASSNHYI